VEANVIIVLKFSPNIDLDIIRNTKCLLLGAGTLGCYVSRCLIGWGINKITFVDNGVVSYSNTARQPLFNVSDVKKEKAVVAANRLQEIVPGIDSSGYTITIPMPGHPLVDRNNGMNDVEILERLFVEHDAVFILTDSRESRWLPTLLGSAMNKIVINAALGFDTYVVLRHGTNQNKYGCYFCNDVVAPSNSLSDRTLDQQCTVTRPGVSGMASSYAVELLISVLQHPIGVDADVESEGLFGSVPHQIRGSLNNFKTMTVVGERFDKCSACSQSILSCYEKDGFLFLEKVFSDYKILEAETGLDKLREQVDERYSDICEWDDE
jgi:ubiquitin-like modifier-activating enzyme ATG7